jgi:hypothetical protein
MPMFTHSKHRIRNAVLIVTLSIAGGLLLTQCRSVTDNVFGRNTSAAKAENCMNACAKQAVELTHSENDLHKANVKACGGNLSCLQAEDARHEAAKTAINEGRKRCQAGCHDQGGGKGR